MEHLARILEKKHAEWLLPNFEAFQVRMELLSGNMEAARLWLDAAEDEWDGITPENFYRMETKAGVYLSLGRYQEALSLREQLQEMISRGNRVLDRADTLSSMALSLEAMGKRELALEKLQEALDLAEPFEYVRVIADKGKNILPLLDALSGGAYLDRVRRAAEDFAFLFRYYKRGLLVGQTTSGATGPRRPSSAPESLSRLPVSSKARRSCAKPSSSARAMRFTRTKAL